MLHNFGMNFVELDFAFQDFLVLKFVKFGVVRLCYGPRKENEKVIEFTFCDLIFLH